MSAMASPRFNTDRSTASSAWLLWGGLLKSQFVVIELRQIVMNEFAIGFGCPDQQEF